MGVGLLDVPDLGALAAAPTDHVVFGDNQPSATHRHHINKRAAKPSTSASRGALQLASSKRARTNSSTTTDCHHRSQVQATKQRRDKSSTPSSAQSTQEDEEAAAVAGGSGGGEEDGWQFVSHNFRVCDGRAVRLTRNREFIFKLRPAPSPPPHRQVPDTADRY
jgi:hypothetical protein